MSDYVTVENDVSMLVSYVSHQCLTLNLTKKLC